MHASNFKLPLWVALILAVVCCAPVVRAGIILTNLPGTSTYPTVGEQPLTATNWAAVGFQMSSVAESFTSFRGYFTSPDGGTLEGGIYSDSSGNPGSLLAAFTNVNVPSNVNAAALMANTTTPFTLQATTSYWVVLHDVIAFDWLRDDASTTPVASSGYTYSGYRTSVNTGGSWSSSTGNWTAEITTTAVPEPGAMVLACLSAAGLAAAQIGLRRKR